jgi:hypothetical protein
MINSEMNVENQCELAEVKRTVRQSPGSAAQHTRTKAQCVVWHYWNCGPLA